MVPVHVPLVRWLHLLAMAVAVGGGALAWATSRTADAATTRAVAHAYEPAFWLALSVLVATGVGNLGALAPAIPRGAWSTALLGKLALVLVVLVGSAVRTAMVWAAEPRADATAPLARSYAFTTAALVAVVGLGTVLAHG